MGRDLTSSGPRVDHRRGGVLERLGITFERIQQVNPRCIMSSATGWGHLGPDRATGSMDFLAQARSGFMSMTGEGGAGADRPARPQRSWLSLDPRRL